MITKNLFLPAALAAVLAAGCANNNGDEADGYGAKPDADAEGLQGWEPTQDEIDLMTEEEYEQQYSEAIDASNVDQEFEKLQEELGGG